MTIPLDERLNNFALADMKKKIAEDVIPDSMSIANSSIHMVTERCDDLKMPEMIALTMVSKLAKINARVAAEAQIERLRRDGLIPRGEKVSIDAQVKLTEDLVEEVLNHYTEQQNTA